MLGGDLNLNSDIDIGEGLGGSLFLGNGPQTDALPSIDDILNAQHDKGKKHGKDGKKVKKKDKAALWTGEDDVFGEDAEIEQEGATDILGGFSPKLTEESDHLSEKEKRYAVLCGGCAHLNAVPDPTQRFVCQKCNQGCCITDDVSVSVTESWVQPLTAPVAECKGSLTFEEWRLRMLRFYAKYAPERVPGRQLDQILRSWAGREDELWERMLQRYGAEPDESEGNELLASVLANQLPPDLPEQHYERQEPLVVAKAAATSATTTTTSSSSPPSPSPRKGRRDSTSPKAESEKSGASPPKAPPTPIPAPPAPLSAVVAVVLDGEKLGCTMRERSDGTLLVLAVKPDSAGARSDLLPYQRVHTCNGEPVAALRPFAALVAQHHTVQLRVSLDPRSLRCGACEATTVLPGTEKTFTCNRCGVRSEVTREGEFVVMPCRPCPDTGADMTFEEWRERIMRFYAKHAPERVKGRQLDQILRSWANREDDMLAKMVERYGAEPSPEEGQELLDAVLLQARPPEEAEEAQAQSSGGDGGAAAAAQGKLSHRASFLKIKTLIGSKLSKQTHGEKEAKKTNLREGASPPAQQ